MKIFENSEKSEVKSSAEPCFPGFPEWGFLRFLGGWWRENRGVLTPVDLISGILDFENIEKTRKMGVFGKGGSLISKAAGVKYPSFLGGVGRGGFLVENGGFLKKWKKMNFGDFFGKKWRKNGVFL